MGLIRGDGSGRFNSEEIATNYEFYLIISRLCYSEALRSGIKSGICLNTLTSDCTDWCSGKCKTEVGNIVLSLWASNKLEYITSLDGKLTLGYIYDIIYKLYSSGIINQLNKFTLSGYNSDTLVSRGELADILYKVIVASSSGIINQLNKFTLSGYNYDTLVSRGELADILYKVIVVSSSGSSIIGGQYIKYNSSKDSLGSYILELNKISNGILDRLIEDGWEIVCDSRVIDDRNE